MKNGKWRLALRIAAVAGLILFLELALIRWLAAYVRVFAFFTNFVIIAAFLGMGTGLLRRTAADRLRWVFPFLLVTLVGVTALLALSPIGVRDSTLEWLWFFPDPAETRTPIPLTVAVIGLFALVTALYVPLGAQLGAAMSQWRALPAYAADLGGSLAGIATFAIASSLELPPVTWFALAGAIWTILCLPHRGSTAASLVATVAAVATVGWLGAREVETWSPYYRITLKPAEAYVRSTQLDVNGALHQVMLDFSAAATHPGMDSVRKDYERPYRLLARLDTALVVGAGTGNDVAILLSLGARHIDAVEIDPTIARIGRERHPLRPYDDPRVHLIVNDARAFLRTPAHHYDVITFGTLDSQTLLGGMSSVRLDNYVYTLESFRAARASLRPGGSLVLYHLSGFWFIAARLNQNIEVAFDAPARVLPGTGRGLFNYTFVAGAGADGAAPLAADSPLRMPVRLATDDWPFPYLRSRQLPAHYLVAIAAVLAIGTLAVGAAAGRKMLRSPDWPLFLIGAGFLLLETKGITTMSLLFGSTWTVNAAVIASILAVALVAAVVTDRGRAPSASTAMVLLALLLAISVFVKPASLVSLAPWMRWLAAGLYVGVPVIFASFLFSVAYARAADPSSALAFNVLGAVAGGVLEYGSMVFGLDVLNWLAIAAYLGAVVLLRRRDRAGLGSAPVTA